MDVLISSLIRRNATAEATRRCGQTLSWRRTLLLLMTMTLFCGSDAFTPAMALNASESEIKAIFIFRFSQFVEWPSNAFMTADMPFVIGVLGEDPFGTDLDNAVSGETVNGRRVVVQRYGRLDKLGDCHILFISNSEAKNLPMILMRLQGRSTLTVGDSDGFARNGGMIRFLNVANKIRLRVNLGAVRNANLSMSSKLLRSADVVGDER